VALGPRPAAGSTLRNSAQPAWRGQSLRPKVTIPQDNGSAGSNGGFGGFIPACIDSVLRGPARRSVPRWPAAGDQEPPRAMRPGEAPL
jgi:hypothetical protein